MRIRAFLLLLLLFSGFPFTVFAMGWELIFGLLTLHVCELLVGKIYIYVYLVMCGDVISNTCR